MNKRFPVVSTWLLLLSLSLWGLVGCMTAPGPNATTQQLASYDQQVTQAYTAAIDAYHAAALLVQHGVIKTPAQYNDLSLGLAAADLLLPATDANTAPLLTQLQQAQAAWATLAPATAPTAQ